MVRNGKWWDKDSDLLLLLVWMILVWMIICLVTCLVDRRLSPHCHSVWTTHLSVLSRIVSHRRVLLSINVQLEYNNVVTCTLPHRAQRNDVPHPFNRCSSSLLPASHHSLPVSASQLVYTHSFALCASDDLTMSRNLVQDGASPSSLSNRVLFAASLLHSVSQSLSRNVVIQCISFEFSEENWDDDFEFGSPSATNSPVQSLRRRSIPSPPHSPPRAHKRTKSRGNGINNLSLTTSTRATRWSADIGGLDDENWDEDEPTIPPIVQSRSVVSREQTSTDVFGVFLVRGSRPAQ